MSFRTESPASSIFCLPTLPQRGSTVGSSCSSPSMQHVARADLVFERLRVVGMEGVLHRVQVIEVAAEFVEAMQRRQELVAVAEVVLAELARRIAQRLERRGDGRRLRGHAERAPAWPTVVSPVRIGSWPVTKLARPAVQLASA